MTDQTDIVAAKSALLAARLDEAAARAAERAMRTINRDRPPEERAAVIEGIHAFYAEAREASRQEALATMREQGVTVPDTFGLPSRLESYRDPEVANDR